jgi:hypothetical protein
MRGRVARIPSLLSETAARSIVAAGLSIPVAAQSEPMPGTWYVEGGAFAEVNADVDPASTVSGTTAPTAGYGGEVRIGRGVLPGLTVDLGLRLGGNGDAPASTGGVDFGFRLETAHFASPYAGLRLGYTHLSGRFEDDWEPWSSGLGETTGHLLHLRPELGLVVGDPRAVRVLAGVVVNLALARRVTATYADGLPVPERELARGAGVGDGLGGRLAVAVAF